MKKQFMDKKELNVKIGDTVAVQGNIGTVTEIYEDSEVLNVRVHFTGELANWGQYQDAVYGGFTVIDSNENTESGGYYIGKPYQFDDLYNGIQDEPF